MRHRVAKAAKRKASQKPKKRTGPENQDQLSFFGVGIGVGIKAIKQR